MDSFSKGCLFLYLQALTGNGMPELQSFGMEVEPIGGLSVEGVAYDGAVQAFGVGGVYTKLVGTACFWVEGDAGSTRVVFLRFFLVIQILFIVIQSGAKDLVCTHVCVIEILRRDAPLDDISGYRWFAIFITYHLQGAVVEVRT